MSQTDTAVYESIPSRKGKRFLRRVRDVAYAGSVLDPEELTENPPEELTALAYARHVTSAPKKIVLRAKYDRMVPVKGSNYNRIQGERWVPNEIRGFEREMGRLPTNDEFTDYLISHPRLSESFRVWFDKTHPGMLRVGERGYKAAKVEQELESKGILKPYEGRVSHPPEDTGLGLSYGMLKVAVKWMDFLNEGDLGDLKWTLEKRVRNSVGHENIQNYLNLLRKVKCERSKRYSEGNEATEPY